MRAYILLWLAAFELSGCAAIPPQEALSKAAIEKVVTDIKRQVSIHISDQYINYDKSGHLKISRSVWCGNGMIDFDITQVKIDLLTTLDNTTTGGLSVANIPVGGGVSLGGGVSISAETTKTQELVLTERVLQPNTDIRYKSSPWSYRYASNIDEPAPLADAMSNMRGALIQTASGQGQVCFSTVIPKAGNPPPAPSDGSDKTSQASNTFKIAISVIDDGKGNLSVGLAPLTVTASGESKSTTGNTITFTFAPHIFK